MRCVAGERRYQASKLAGLEELPVIIKDVDDEEMLALALIENLQRSGPEIPSKRLRAIANSLMPAV